MGSLVAVLFVWAVFASVVGCAFAYIEGRVNGKPPRWLSCILWSVLGGVIGWIVLAMRSGLTYSSTQRKNQAVMAEAARVTLAQQQPQPQRDSDQG